MSGEGESQLWHGRGWGCGWGDATPYTLNLSPFASRLPLLRVGVQVTAFYQSHQVFQQTVFCLRGDRNFVGEI